jgi:hypothetical protein
MFDAANRQVCKVRASITSTPLHALTTLNDPTWAEAARVLAAHSMEAAPETDARLTFAFRRVLGRAPTPADHAALHRAYERQHAIYSADQKPRRKSLPSVPRRGPKIFPPPITPRSPPSASRSSISTRRLPANESSHAPGHSAQPTASHAPPAFRQRCARHRWHRARLAARALSLPVPRSPVCRSSRIFRRRRNASSACGRAAVRRTSIFSTGSRCSKKWADRKFPRAFRGTTRLSTMTAGNKKWPITPAIKPYRPYGQCGTELSELLPHIGSIADDICVVRSMNTEAVNHAPGVTFFMTGAQVPGRPSMGAWLSYGLGCDAGDLPAFVVMTSSDKGRTCGQLFYDYYWGSGFLPSRFQGVRFRNVGDPVPYLQNPPGMSREQRRTLLDDIQAMNATHLADYGDPEIDTRIAQYEMAFKMQASVPDFSISPPNQNTRSISTVPMR